MGNILLVRQQEELYPPETLCSGDSLAYESMAKPPTNQEHRAVKAVRGNIESLMNEQGMSYRDVTKAARASKSAGRNINNLVLGTNYPRIDSVAAAADSLQMELWQLCVPKISEMDRIERKQLKDLVETFVMGGSAAREFLVSALKLMKPPPPGAQDTDRV